tara:strand:- start:223 stop:549 length:327 start_codon:yes stop_codon:yes gene_type:complete
MIVAAILKNVLSGGAKYPKGRGAPVAMAKKNRDAKKRNDMMDTVMRNNEHSNKMSARSGGAARGPTVAEQVAARKAAKLAARKSKGQAGRKKYEQAMTQAKKMKLLFT